MHSFLLNRLGITLDTALFLLHIKRRKRITNSTQHSNHVIAKEVQYSQPQLTIISKQVIKPQPKQQQQLERQPQQKQQEQQEQPKIEPPKIVQPSTSTTVSISQVITSALSTLLTSSPTTQLVIFGSAGDPVYLPSSSSSSNLSIFIVDDVALNTRRVSPIQRQGLIYVDAVLDGCVWDSLLVLNGYNWQTRSVWLVVLNQLPSSSFQTLERHFRMISTLASPDSPILIIYSDEKLEQSLQPDMQSISPIYNLVTTSGFEISYDVILSEAAKKYISQDSHLEPSDSQLRLALLTHSQRYTLSSVNELEYVSEVTYSAKSASASNSIAPTIMSTTAASLDTLDSLAEYQQLIASDKRIVRFELNLESLPKDLKHWNHHVLVLGSDPSLGCWDPHRAKEMNGKIDIEKGIITADLALSVQATNVEYKYAVANQTAQIIAWETGCNRILSKCAKDSLNDDCAQCVKDDWRS